MKIGVFQFSATDDLNKNHTKIVSAITKAAEKQVRLLVFQECATCGYPPIERANVEDIDFISLEKNFKELYRLASEHNMYIAIGTITKRDGEYFNSIQLINPDGELLGTYDKRALWGWDTTLSNFNRGSDKGIYVIDGINIGFRICFEIRFPEYFRELYMENTKLCFVIFNDIESTENQNRYDLIKAHLQTRAVENIMTIVSVNSISKCQTAPTAVINHNGEVVLEAPKNQEYLLVYDYSVPEITFGMEGRSANNDILLKG
jgi:predicted amidohydrolase